jgi:hypothetical protein
MLVLSKIDYADIVYHPLPQYLNKSFVIGRYATTEDILKLN